MVLFWMLVAFLRGRKCSVEAGGRNEVDGSPKTHRQLVKILRTCSEDRNTQFVNKAPQVRGVAQGAAIVQHKRASETEAMNKIIPHHPSTAKHDQSAPHNSSSRSSQK